MIGLDPTFADKLVRGLSLAQMRHQIKATITSGHRQREEQQRLYDRYRAGRGPLAAAPGRSCHEYGAAADIIIAQKPPAMTLEGAVEALAGSLRTVGLDVQLYPNSRHVHAQDTALCDQLRGQVLPAKPQLPSRSPAGSRSGPLSDPPLTPAGKKGCP